MERDLEDQGLRLRFFGKSNNIATIRADLTNDLTQLTASGTSPVIYFHFGNHGSPGQYSGEAGYWGKDWSMAIGQNIKMARNLAYFS